MPRAQNQAEDSDWPEGMRRGMRLRSSSATLACWRRERGEGDRRAPSSHPSVQDCFSFSKRINKTQVTAASHETRRDGTPRPALTGRPPGGTHREMCAGVAGNANGPSRRRLTSPRIGCYALSLDEDAASRMSEVISSGSARQSDCIHILIHIRYRRRVRALPVGRANGQKRQKRRYTRRHFLFTAYFRCDPVTLL